MSALPPPYYPPEVDVLSQQRLELESAMQAQQQPAGVIVSGLLCIVTHADVFSLFHCAQLRLLPLSLTVFAMPSVTDTPT